MKNSFLYELQIMRGIALLSVVLIHFMNICILKLPEGDSTYWVYYFLGLLSQYAVPCFLLIAAILVSFSENKIFNNLPKFYISKVPRIIIPYILWSILYILARYFTGSVTDTQISSVHSWIFWLLWGKGYGHLYFVSIILQFYLVAPLLIKAVKLLRDKWYLMLAISILMQLLFYFINKHYIFPRFPYPATLLIRYLGIIIPGIWIGFNYTKTLAFLSKYWYYIGIICLLSTGFYIYDSLNILNKIPIKSLNYQLNWYCYVVTSSLLWLIISYKLSKKQGKPQDWLIWLGKVSFGVYLIHPLCIVLFNKFIGFSNPILLLLTLITGVFSICIIVGKIVEMMSNLRFIGLLVGEVPKPLYRKNNRQPNESETIH